MTIQEFSILAHCLGVTSKIPNTFSRNMFVAGDKHEDYEALQSLWKMGYMTKSNEQKLLGNSRLYTVTDLGIKRFKECFEALSPVS